MTQSDTEASQAPTPGAKPAVPVSSTLLGSFVSTLVGHLGRLLSPTLVQRVLTWSREIGQWAVIAGAALTVVYAIYAAVKFDSFSHFLTGLGLVLGLAVGQFAAMRFLGAGETLVANSPSRLASPAFLECLGLLLLFGALGVLVGGIRVAILVESAVPLVPAVFVTVLMVLVAAIALHPALVNVEVSEGGAGEEAIGLLSFFFKTTLRIVPVLFLVGSVGGALAILVSFTESGRAVAGQLAVFGNMLPMRISYMTVGFLGTASVLVACLVPLVAWFAFLLQYLLIDLIRAILVVPARLEALRR